jgi:hypothetical protein
MAVTVTDAATAGDGEDVPAEDGADVAAVMVLLNLFLAATVRFVMFLSINLASALQAKHDFRRDIVPFLMFAFKW